MKLVEKFIDIRIFTFCVTNILSWRIKSFFKNKKISEQDKVFWDRLLYNPKAFLLSFRKKHFELGSLAQYKEINWNMLDFWCGSGHLDILLAKQGYTIHGIDLSPIGIQIAKKLAAITKTKNISFEFCDITQKEPKEKFDCCRATQVFEHITDPQEIFEALRKRMKPNGHMLISVPLGYAYDDAGHVNHFMDDKDLEKYLHRHIKIKNIDIDKRNKVIRALCYF